jgi:hypothetical protein
VQPFCGGVSPLQPMRSIVFFSLVFHHHTEYSIASKATESEWMGVEGLIADRYRENAAGRRKSTTVTVPNDDSFTSTGMFTACWKAVQAARALCNRQATAGAPLQRQWARGHRQEAKETPSPRKQCRVHLVCTTSTCPWLLSERDSATPAQPFVHNPVEKEAFLRQILKPRREYL